MRLLGRYLHAAGHTVVAPLLAGHGTRVEDLEHVDWRDWVESAAVVAHGRQAMGERLHFFGLSMGGLLSLLLAPTFDAASVGTLNAPQRVFDRLGSLAKHTHRVRPYHFWEPTPPPDPTVAEYAIQYHGTHVKAVGELFTLIRAVGRSLDRVECPTLIIQSRADQTVRPESAEHLLAGVGAATKRMVWLERSAHVATLDVERDRIHRVVREHVETAAR